MSFNNEDMIIFDNSNGYTDINDDIPPELNTSSATMQQINSEFTLVEDLFFDKTDTEIGRINLQTNKINEPYEIDEMINIYKTTNETKGEFLDLTFRGNLLPFSLGTLINLTELTIRYCQLDEITITPPNLKKLTCNNCNLKIVSCKDITSTIEYINFSNNDIELITDFEHLNMLKYLNLDNNKISYINDLSKSIQILSIKNNLLTTAKFLDQDLRELYISGNRIDDIEYLLDSIEILDISKNNIGIIVLLPLKLKILTAFNCKLNKILCSFPPYVEKIDLYNNSLIEIPDFNHAMKWADLSSNDLRKLPNNISNLDYLDISSNPNLTILPLEQNWKDFMYNMNAGKQFMMDTQYENNDNLQQSDEIVYVSSDSENILDSSTENEDTEDNDEMDEQFKEKLLRKYDIFPPKYNDVTTSSSKLNFKLTPQINYLCGDINNDKNNDNNQTNNDEEILNTIRNIRFRKQQEFNNHQLTTIYIKPKRYVNKSRVFTI